MAKSSRQTSIEHEAAPQAAPFTIVGQGGVALELRFDSLDDFTPDAIARKVDALRATCEAHGRLVDMLGATDEDTRAEAFMAWMMDEPAPAPAPVSTAATAPHDAEDKAGADAKAAAANTARRQGT